MNGRSRPYFCGIDRSLNFQQKEALAQGILQVVETIPDGFKSFEFQFTDHQVHIYKLEHGIILLVLTRKDLNYSDYLETIKDLKVALQEDINNAIATFRLIVGNSTLSGMKYCQGRNSPALYSTSPTSSSDKADPTTSGFFSTRATPIALTDIASRQSTGPRAFSPAPPLPPTERSLRPMTPTTNADDGNTTEPTLKDLIAALNHLSQFTTQYLGTHVIANYWKSTRPEHNWLAHLQIDRSAQFKLTGAATQEMQRSLTPHEQQWIQEWVAAFMKRCSQVIRNFPTIVEQTALDNDQRTLLLG